jgi:hypothetical protein
VEKNRTPFLILISLALAALVWFDNRQPSVPEMPPAPMPSDRPATEATRQKLEPVQRMGASANSANAAQLANPLSSFDKAELKDMIERPLFASRRRRPPPTEQVEAPAAPTEVKPQPPSFELLGIVRDGEHAIALLRRKDDGTNFRVEVGDMIGGWRVSKLEPKAVLLEREDGTSQLVPLF